MSPSPLIESLPVEKQRGRIVVDETMAVPGHEGVWACGDCAAVPSPSGKPCPPTAQHAIRQGTQAARNIAAAVRGDPAKIRPYRYEMLGQFAAIGRQRAVATLFGVRFSGFIAWLMWRGACLLMLPRLERKVRVFLQWMLEICFARDTVQLLTAESVRSGRIDELMNSGRAAESAGRRWRSRDRCRRDRCGPWPARWRHCARRSASSSGPTYIDTCDHVDRVRRLTSSAQRVLPAQSSMSPQRRAAASA